MTENEREIRHLLAVAHAALVPHTIDNLYWFVRVKRALAIEEDAATSEVFTHPSGQPAL